MKIVQFTAENIKRLKLVQITPKGHLVPITGRNGQGKQQPVTERVLTPQGWTMIGAVDVGDFVIGSQGSPVQVTGVYPQENRETYRVTMADGASTRCGPEHLWTLSRWNERNGGKDRVTETLTTAEIIRRGLRRGTARKWAVPIVGPVEFEPMKENLPIDPYTLGVILGDGHIEPTGYTTITSWDPEVLDAVAPKECWREARAIGSGFWSRPLQHLNLAGLRAWEKFIPHIYLHSSIEERWALLAGLLDTDGTAMDSWAGYCTTSEQLAEGVVEVASSLGCVCKKRDGATKKYRYKGELKEGRTAWIITIKSHQSPFSLKRKSSLWSKSSQRGENWRFIDTIKRVEDENSVCIKVNAEDGLYVTSDFILTHNTSVLDAIWYALGGKENIPAAPIRKGADKGTITLNLGDFIVERTFTFKKCSECKGEGKVAASAALGDGPGGTASCGHCGGTGTTGQDSTIKVKSKDGQATYNSPQKMLDALVGQLSFDPLAFARAEGPAAFAILRDTVKVDVDFDAIKKANDEDYAERSRLNKIAKQQRALAASIVIPENLPAELIDENALLVRMQAVYQQNSENARVSSERKRSYDEIVRDKEHIRGRIVELQRLRERVLELEGAIALLEKSASEREQIMRDLPEIPNDESPDEIRRALDEAKATNDAIKRRTHRATAIADAEKHEAESLAATKRMEERETAKQLAVQTAKMPVEGLGFGDGCVTFNGLPFDQASDAERLRVSIAIAMATNPKLRVIRIRDGSLLDENSMQLIAEMAKAADYQCWVESVSSAGNIGIVMEDGEVVADNQEEKANA